MTRLISRIIKIEKEIKPEKEIKIVVTKDGDELPENWNPDIVVSQTID